VNIIIRNSVSGAALFVYNLFGGLLRSTAAAVATELYRRRVVVVVGPANGPAWPFWIPRQRNYRLRPLRARAAIHTHTHVNAHAPSNTPIHGFEYRSYTYGRACVCVRVCTAWVWVCVRFLFLGTRARV